MSESKKETTMSTVRRYFLQISGDHLFVDQSVQRGYTQIGEPVESATRLDALQQLGPAVKAVEAVQAGFKALARGWAAELGADDDDACAPDDAAADAVFRSAHDAVRFAISYIGQRSPSSPLAAAAGVTGSGRGKGLQGMQAAGQAGMILGAMTRLLDDVERNVLLVRFGASLQAACPCCGHYGHPGWWVEAVANLALCEHLHDLPKALRDAIVCKTVGRQKLRVQDRADGYEVTERTLRRRVALARDHFGRIENAALGTLQAAWGAKNFELVAA